MMVDQLLYASDCDARGECNNLFDLFCNILSAFIHIGAYLKVLEVSQEMPSTANLRRYKIIKRCMAASLCMFAVEYAAIRSFPRSLSTASSIAVLVQSLATLATLLIQPIAQKPKRGPSTIKASSWTAEPVLWQMATGLIALMITFVAAAVGAPWISSLVPQWLFAQVSCLGNVLAKRNSVWASGALIIRLGVQMALCRECFTLPRKESKHGMPFMSRVTYHWVLNFLKTKDSQCVPHTLNLSPLYKRFANFWEYEEHTGRLSLAHAILKTFARSLTLSSGLRLLVRCNEVILPVMVGKILGSIGTSSGTAVWEILGYMALSILAMILEQNQIDLHDRTSLEIQLTLTAAVHSRVLANPQLHRVLEECGSDVYTCGAVTTRELAKHIVDLSEAIWLPVRVGLGLYVFYRQIGWAIAPGLAIILVYLPLRSHLLSRISLATKSAMEVRSERVALISQLVENIVSVRLLAWDEFLMDKIKKLRENAELKFVVDSSFSWAMLTAFRNVCQSGGPLLSLFIYSVAGSGSSWMPWSSNKDEWIAPERVFLVQTILRELFPLLISAPHAFDSLWKVRQPYRLISLALCDKPQTMGYGQRCKSKQNIIELEDATFRWRESKSSNEQNAALSNITISCVRGELLAVVGRVGSGKSALFTALLGEMDQVSGFKRHAPSLRFAYVSQTPWLMNDTIRSNITFGCAFDAFRYNQTLRACELHHDLSRMSNGDSTVVGVNGLALSGGQRARIALARAVYAEADIYLIDDVLASVDRNVASRLIENVFSNTAGILRHATRVLVTKDPMALVCADRIVLVADGKVADIVGSSRMFGNPLEFYEISGILPSGHCSSISTVDQGTLPQTPPNSVGSDSPQLNEKGRSKKVKKQSADSAGPDNDQQIMGPARYMVRLCGVWMVCMHILTVSAQSLASRRAQYWLSNPIPLTDNTNEVGPWWESLAGGSNPTWKHFAACALWWFADILLGFGVEWWTTVEWRRAIFVKSHNELLTSIVHAPLGFFSSMSTGKILDLFTSNQDDVDKGLPQRVADVGGHVVWLVFESAVILMFHPMLVLVVGISVVATKYIVDVSRGPLEALISAVSKTEPRVSEQYQESILGASTIRVFGRQKYASSLLTSRISEYANAQRAEDSVETWIDLSISVMREMVTSSAFLIAAACSASGRPISPAYMSIVHMCTTFHLARLQHLTRTAHGVRSSFEKASRYIKYTKLATETRIESSAGSVPENWPSCGSIAFDHVYAHYHRPGKWVLEDVTFQISAGSHVGIVGRTGAGKTSIAMALFGMLELDYGRIFVDGVDISEVSTKDLRSTLSIVPQSPVMLQGTVRDNLDPFEKHDDERIKEFLEKVGLADVSLESKVQANGSGWSVGQKQMLCLARALLKRSPVIILDEATGAVDGSTNEMLSKLVRSGFEKSTVVSITHRIESVRGCDLVVVVDDGRILQIGTPEKVLGLGVGFPSLITPTVSKPNTTVY